MVFKEDASDEHRVCYWNARDRFMRKGGVEGIKERLDGCARNKERVAAGASHPRSMTAESLSAKITKFEKILEKAEGTDKE